MAKKQNHEHQGTTQDTRINARSNENTAQNSPQQTTQEHGAQSSSQAIQAGGGYGGSRQGELARRGAGIPSVFSINPYEMMLNPFNFMRRFQDEMDRFFEDLGAMSPGSTTGRGAVQQRGFGGGIFSPQVEVFERENNLVVRADLPGMNKDDVHIELTNDGLVIEGERRYEHQSNESGVHRSERSYGSFRRLIPLPEGINAENATATFKNGVLEVTMQAPQPQQNRHRLEIQDESTDTQTSSGQKTQAKSAGK